jgi:hypothetical protein
MFALLEGTAEIEIRGGGSSCGAEQRERLIPPTLSDVLGYLNAVALRDPACSARPL